MQKAVFFDRDGVIVEPIIKNGKPFSARDIEEFRLMPEAIKPLKILKEHGFLNIVITNQPDIARGLITTDAIEKMNAFLKGKLPVDDIFVCPHDDADNCSCRKPKPGMLFEAARKWNVDLQSTFFVGDQWKDTDAGKQAGCKTIIIDYPYNKQVKADFRASNLAAAVKIVLDRK